MSGVVHWYIRQIGGARNDGSGVTSLYPRAGWEWPESRRGGGGRRSQHGLQELGRSQQAEGA